MKRMVASITLLIVLCMTLSAQAQFIRPEQIGQATLKSLIDCVDSGSTNAYTCQMTPTLTDYDDLGFIMFVSTTFTNTAASSLNIDGLGSVNITKADGENVLDPGDIQAGVPYLLYYDGTFFRMPPSTAIASSPGLTTVMSVDSTDYDATTPSTWMRIGKDANNHWVMGWDLSSGPLLNCVVGGVLGDCDKTFRLNSGYSFHINDSSNNEVFNVDESTGLITYPTTAKHPKKSVWFGAGSLSSDGTQCADPAEVTINSGPKLWTIICADNDASTIYGSVGMPDNWDGGTVTFEGQFIQTAADTANMNSDIAAQCKGNGETVNSTWGTEIAMDITGMSGSNAKDDITTAAVTPDGTCAGGDTLFFRWQLDATGTTTAVATLHVLGFKMEYGVSGNSD